MRIPFATYNFKILRQYLANAFLGPKKKRQMCGVAAESMRTILFIIYYHILSYVKS